MELIIREKNATICLNMIVKNESHIIENTLEKLCKKINFDYWVICDTGSTDNTPQIITNFFEKMGIKGELYYDEWTDFAHNRTLALQRAYRKTDLLLIFDADDEIVGNVIMPTEVLYDDYHMKFGSSSGTSYTRVLLINNNKKYKFLSVIHEFITCIDGPTSSTIISGDYYVVSGRSGSRNMDPNKYLKDALILEKAHAEALKNNDHLFHRYAYYCANSYKDCGRFEDAIKWYKITLNQENQWEQEKYTSCLYIYDCYKALNQEINGYYYLVKAFAYDKERVECLYPLLVHYSCENIHQIAYSYYTQVKDFFENRYLVADMSRKLFTIPDKYNFFVPYYMIIIADKVQDFRCVIRMYEIIFIKKQPMFDEWYIKNLLYNLQFFLQHIPKDNTHFVPLANDYITFLFLNGVKLQSFNFLTKDEYKNHGINIENYIIKEVTFKTQKYSRDECANSKNILIYTGFADIEWNYTYMLNNALGGSEKAVAYISKCFPKDFNIFISGHVKNEIIDNIQYIHLDQLTNLIDTTPFHTVIVSRYIGFYEMFQTCSFYQSFIWAHDILLLPYGSNLNENHILKKWNNYINGCVCLTEWHKAVFLDKYPELNNKITLINNGLDLESFPTNNNILKNKKNKNKFIYTSRPDRGLNILLKLWPQIIENIPDATLTISTYGTFPSNAEELIMKSVIDATPSINYLGKLNVEQLYLEMSSSEFWLYPTHWPETSCITALEMLMSEVICLYYPVAGLPFTIDKYGIQIKPGSEIEEIVSLTDLKKDTLRKNGREYAEQCSWSNRYELWDNTLFNTNTNIRNRIYELYNIGFIPKNHIDFLKKLAIDFTPKIIYDIGSNVLSWTREAKNIWPTSEIIAFDAVENVEFLYKEHNIKYHIGVLSKEDNSVVRFYENNIHPAGNSYYKEIGHSISNELYPENVYTEKNTNTLSTVVQKHNFLLPDLIKIDVQGSELDIIMGGLDVINTAKYLIVELQDTQYNKGAPLADTTINFLENNMWELVAPKFCDNGPDADYCFKNKRYDTNIKWAFLIPSWYSYDGLHDYFDNLKTLYNLIYTKDVEYLKAFNPTRVTFVCEINDTMINYCNNHNIEVSVLNTEPLTIYARLQQIIYNCNKVNNIKIYDYSNSNIKILNENGFINTEYLPYIITKEENTFLKELNDTTEKIYDFAIISNDNPISCIRRLNVVNFLMSNGYKVHIIGNLWKKERDVELAKCRIVLNIHGEYMNTASNIFEHLRCDRLLEANYNILSEDNYCLDLLYIEKYKHKLQIIKYDDFFNLDTYKNLRNDIKFIKNIYDTLCLNQNPFDYYLNPVDIYEHLPTLYKYATECNSILECGVRASVSSWALAYGLINNNSETKKLILNDISPCDISNLLKYTKNIHNLNVSYQWISDLDIILNENVDLTFIDTWHVGGHLKKELEKFSKLTNKYIIMHDTTVDEFTSEAIRANLSEKQIYDLSASSGLSVEDIKMGLWPAIEKFLQNNNDWILHERFTNNNGLTILKKKQPKIIDCFTFYNELNMLNYRLNVLNDVVDYFILVEARQTHVGKEKNLFFDENKKMFEKFNDKIIHIVVDLPFNESNINITNREQWTNEIFQRNCIKQGLEKIKHKFNDDTHIVISDVDEIPDPKTLLRIRNKNLNNDINMLEQELYYYNLNSKWNEYWYNCKTISYKKYRELNVECNDIRFINGTVVKNGGWHLSYFGDVNFIKNKMENFAHQEFNSSTFTDTDKISEKIKNGLDLYNRDTNNVSSIRKIAISENKYLPPFFEKYLSLFYE